MARIFQWWGAGVTVSAQVDKDERRQLEELSARLREAICAALQSRSALARSLDESRSELERLLMLSSVDGFEYRRAVVRAEMMLGAWKTLAASVAAAR